MDTVPNVPLKEWRDWMSDPPYNTLLRDAVLELRSSYWNPLGPSTIVRLRDIQPQMNVYGLSWRKLEG